MKKGWKIALISVGSLLGLLILVVGVALWMVFTPSQLTKIVNGLTAKYLDCDAHFENIDLTLFRTFPDAGLQVDEVVVVNPKEGAPSDTLAYVKSLTVGVDVRAFLKEKEVIVHQVLLDGVAANLFIASDGSNNFSVFPSNDSSDADADEGGAELPSVIDLQRLKISNLNAHLLDERDKIEVALSDMDLGVKGALNLKQVSGDLDLTLDQTEVRMWDSLGADLLDTRLKRVACKVKGGGDMEYVNGKVNLVVEEGLLNAAGDEMINAQLQASDEDLLTANIPFEANLRDGRIHIDMSTIKVDRYALKAEGAMRLADSVNPMKVEAEVATVGQWQIGQLLQLLPAQYLGWKQGMEVDARVGLSAKVDGELADGVLPQIDLKANLSEGVFSYPKAIPYKVRKIGGDVAAVLNIGSEKKSSAKVQNLRAVAKGIDLKVDADVDDLLGDMLVDASVKGNLPLPDLMPLLPDSLPLSATGTAAVDLKLGGRLSDVQALSLERLKASGNMAFKQLNVHYDSIDVVAPQLDFALKLPAVEHAARLADAHIEGASLQVAMANAGVDATVESPVIDLGINNPLKQQIAVDLVLNAGEAEAIVDSMMVSLGALSLQGTMQMDSMQKNVIQRFHPDFDIDMHSAVLYSPTLPDAIRMPQFTFLYRPKTCEIKTAQVRVGHTDCQLYGTVDNLEDWLDGKKMLKGDINFVSNYADVDQLMHLFSGMGSDADSLETMRVEDSVPDEANPFIVPRDVDITLHTHIKRSIAFGNDLNDVSGTLTVKDGTAILDQMGFVCKAATMQLTALYRSPRPNNLFASIDFHLLDIQIDELLDMIPCVDTLVPMLAAFDGNANFHLAGESFLDAFYHPKMSSLLGSAAISGKDLVVLDDNNIAQIAKLMQFKSWKDKDNKLRIDSLDVEMTCFRKEIEVYPFLLNIGKYQLCVAGKHTLDNVCNYHLELLKNPLLARVGVDVKGPLSSPKISLGQVKYADLYRPEKQGVVEKRTLQLKQDIRKALESNVK